MPSMESVDFRLYIPIQKRLGEAAHLYLYYCGELEERAGPFYSRAQDHTANGDLQGGLTAYIIPPPIPGLPKYRWRLDENTIDALWTREALIHLEKAQHGALQEFLTRCLHDAMLHPSKPFRAVFTYSDSTPPIP